MKYYTIYFKGNPYILGDMDWYEKNYNKITYKGIRSRSWRTDIGGIDVQVESISKKIIEYPLTWIDYYYAQMVGMSCIRNDVLEILKKENVLGQVNIGKIHKKNKLFEAFSTYLPINKLAISLMKNDVSDQLMEFLDGKPIYFSDRYDFIVREDLYEKISHIDFKNCNLGIFDNKTGWRKYTKKPKIIHSPVNEKVFEYIINKIKFSNKSKHANDDLSLIESYEKSMKVKFPEDFKRVITECNGYPYVTKKKLLSVYDFCMDRSLYISTNIRYDLLNYFDSWGGMFTYKKFIPIISSDSGDYICISARKKDYGVVYVYEHESDEIREIAPTFYHFLSNLQ